MSMKQFSTVILSIALLLIPLAIWAEGANYAVWNNRLLIPYFEDEPNRHTPFLTAGTYLRPTIDQDTTLSPTNNPIIVTGTTTIQPNVTVIILPGTQFVMHEFAGLINHGKLHANGSSTNPIVFTTNETHPLNQTWNGITSSNASTTTLNYTHIQYASPGISCLTGSQVTVNNSRIETGAVGLYAETPNCRITNSTIKDVNQGVVTINSEPLITNTIISARQNNIKNVVSP